MQPDFNPRAPCGARPISDRILCAVSGFQSTRPLRGATGEQKWRVPCCIISIHAPLAGRDYYQKHCKLQRRNFNPRAPCGARPVHVRRNDHRKPISIHAPLAGRDMHAVVKDAPHNAISIHAPLAGRDPRLFAVCLPCTFISIHAPLAGRDLDPDSILPQPHFISIHAPLAGRDSKLDEFLSANLRKSNKRDLLSEEKMRHGLPRTTCMSHFRSFFGCEAEAVFCPLALRT